MSVLGNNILIGASGQTPGDDPGGGGDDPTQFNSAEFIRANSSDLTRTFGSGGNRQKWTFSAWMKRQGNFGQVQRFFAVEGNQNTDEDWFSVFFFTDNTIVIGGYANFFARSSQYFTDPSAYFHFVLAVDMSTTEKFKIFINNEEIALTLVSPPAETGINRSGADHFIGSEVGGAYFDGRMSNIQFVDSAYLTASDFGEYRSDGVWGHKQWGGSWGTTGFHLDFDDLSDLGKDAVGSKNWTPRNLSGSIDGPNNNFCTLNPLNISGGSLSNLNRTYTIATNAATRGTVAVSSGKYYFEVNLTTNGNPYIGIGGKGQLSAGGPGYVGDNGVALNRDGDIYYRYGGSTTYPGKSATLSTGVIGIAIDATSKKIWWSKNGTWYKFSGSTNQSCTIADVESGNFGFEFPLIEGDHLTVHLGNSSGNTSVFTLNSGEDGFAYTVPSGYKRLCTADLPATISDGSEHFDIKLYQGDGAASRSVGGYSFSPNFVWAKARTGTYYNGLFDSVRSGYALYSNENLVEDTSEQMAFTSDGFTTPAKTGDFVNASSLPYVAWAWKANSSTVSNTDGTVSAQVSANASAGFSIVTATQAAQSGLGCTVGHGLGKAPDMYIVKDRDAATAWGVYHKLLGATKALQLNTNSGELTTSGYFNDTEPTSSVITVGSGVALESDDFVAYCFSAVEGYSSTGIYRGNGSASDGPFVYTGFAVKYLMVKRINTTSWWSIWDATRDTYNPRIKFLAANVADQEYTGSGTSDIFDFLCNGFKLNADNADINGSGDDYLYLAFASHPFKYSRTV